MARRGPGEECLASGGIPFAGDLTLVERAQIANWFYHSIPGAQAKEATQLWMGRAPLAHAFTIFLSVRHRGRLIREATPSPLLAGTDIEIQAALWKEAWKCQCATFLDPKTTDVDVECLKLLEKRMFENSFDAGVAGNQQWGLDAGAHQKRWYPYGGLPSDWNHEDRHTESESEHLVRIC